MSSNLRTLPVDALEYIRLCHEKRRLTTEQQRVNQALRACNTRLLEHMKHTQTDVYEICPQIAEQPVYGGLGVLQLKVKNDYEVLTRERLMQHIVEFFKFALPDNEEAQIVRLGVSMTNWIWSHREKCPKHVIERVYQEDLQRKYLKRKKTVPSVENKRPPKKPQPLLAITREDFSNMPAFRQLTGLDE